MLLSELGTNYNGFIGASFRYRTVREAERLLVSLKLYKLHYRNLPPRLASLQELGLPGPAPIDMYADAPFHYDRARSIFWSVGEKSVNDGGQAEPRRWRGPDIVWHIP